MSAPQQEFERLVELLKAKKDPHPPPQFFDKMSEQILDRLRHPEPEAPTTWWQRVSTDINLKACAVGVVVSGLVLYAILSAVAKSPKGGVSRNQAFYLYLSAATNDQVLSPPSVSLIRVAPVTQPQTVATSGPISMTPMSSISLTDPVYPPSAGKKSDNLNPWNDGK